MAAWEEQEYRLGSGQGCIENRELAFRCGNMGHTLGQGGMKTQHIILQHQLLILALHCGTWLVAPDDMHWLHHLAGDSVRCIAATNLTLVTGLTGLLPSPSA